MKSVFLSGLSSVVWHFIRHFLNCSKLFSLLGCMHKKSSKMNRHASKIREANFSSHDVAMVVWNFQHLSASFNVWGYENKATFFDDFSLKVFVKVRKCISCGLVLQVKQTQLPLHCLLPFSSYPWMYVPLQYYDGQSNMYSFLWPVSEASITFIRVVA